MNEQMQAAIILMVVLGGVFAFCALMLWVRRQVMRSDQPKGMVMVSRAKLHEANVTSWEDAATKALAIMHMLKLPQAAWDHPEHQPCHEAIIEILLGDSTS